MRPYFQFSFALNSRTSGGNETRDAKKARQPSVVEALKQTGREVKQSSVDEAIVNLIVNRMLPFSAVEWPEFKALVVTLNPEKTCMTRPTLTKRISDKHTFIEGELIR